MRTSAYCSPRRASSYRKILASEMGLFREGPVCELALVRSLSTSMDVRDTELPYRPGIRAGPARCGRHLPCPPDFGPDPNAYLIALETSVTDLGGGLSPRVRARMRRAATQDWRQPWNVLQPSTGATECPAAAVSISAPGLRIPRWCILWSKDQAWRDLTEHADSQGSYEVLQS